MIGTVGSTVALSGIVEVGNDLYFVYRVLRHWNVKAFDLWLGRESTVGIPAWSLVGVEIATYPQGPIVPSGFEDGTCLTGEFSHGAAGGGVQFGVSPNHGEMQHYRIPLNERVAVLDDNFAYAMRFSLDPAAGTERVVVTVGFDVSMLYGKAGFA